MFECNLEPRSEHFCFGGKQLGFEHKSETTGTKMSFSVFLPPAPGKLPVLWYLSGLTCTDQNVVTKGGFQRVAADLGLIVVCPDTSPRGAGIKGEDESYDLGTGAGFYLDATAKPWDKNYRMRSYLLGELPEYLFPAISADPHRQSIFGHSMGGHGALTLGISHPDRFRSVSAFSPVVAPSKVPWGKKALGTYLSSKDEWAQYDACELIKQGKRASSRLLIDQGKADQFLEEQLKPELLREACDSVHHPLELRVHEGYDHSYFFISTFMEDHLRFHYDHLKM